MSKNIRSKSNTVKPLKLPPIKFTLEDTLPKMAMSRPGLMKLSAIPCPLDTLLLSLPNFLTRLALPTFNLISAKSKIHLLMH